ncbi:MAG: 3D domain-containing protein [Candidatus Aenigmarchaeota archaeon]|nr:3D domain-containing protein [Candidatus Aenigmarchaeota archaeon]
MQYRSRRFFAALLAAAALLVAKPSIVDVQKKYSSLPEKSSTAAGENYLNVPVPFFQWHQYKGGVESFKENGRGTKVPYFRPQKMPYRASAGICSEYEVTAYTACDFGMNCKGLAANRGKPVKLGMAAADPSIPFGSMIRIEAFDPSSHESTALPPIAKKALQRAGVPPVLNTEDRGGAIKGRRLDVYFESKRDALDFGRRRLKACVEIPVYAQKSRARISQ